MNKKIPIVCLLISILIFMTFTPATAAQPTFRIFRFETKTDVELSNTSLFDDPVPAGTNVEIDVEIKFKFEKPALFPSFLLESKLGNWIMFRDRNQNMTTAIELAVESPDFCTAKLESSKILIQNFSTDFNDPVTTKLNITVKEDALALQTGKIIVKANFTPGEKWSLNESGDVAEFSVTTAFESDISAQVENTTIKITPQKSTFIPIELKNDGNDKVLIDLKIENVPKNWSLSFAEDLVEIAAGKSKTVELNVTSIKNFNNETISLKFTPKLSSDNTQSGKTISLSLLIENDGSLEEDGLEIDITLLIILLTIILVVFIAIILVVTRKNK